MVLDVIGVHLDAWEIGGGWEERKAGRGWGRSSLHACASNGEGLPCLPQPIRMYFTNKERSLALPHPSACALQRACHLCTRRSSPPSPASLGLLYRWAVYFLSTESSLWSIGRLYSTYRQKSPILRVCTESLLCKEKSLTLPVCVLLWAECAWCAERLPPFTLQSP